MVVRPTLSPLSLFFCVYIYICYIKKMCVWSLSLISSSSSYLSLISYISHTYICISERTAAQSCIQDRIGAESEREREREREIIITDEKK